MTMLKKFRLERDITQNDMAKNLGISLNGYRNYENGRRNMPYEILIKFLITRNETDDIKLANILQELLVKKI